MEETLVSNSKDILTLLIAAYAAIISTFVLGWDSYKYFASGAKININASMNMKVFGGYQEDKNTYTSVSVQNVGDRPTTIINLGGMYYSSWWRAYFFKRKPDEAFIIAQPSDTQPIPYRFEVGSQWIGMTNQTAELEEKAKNGYLFIILYTACNGHGKRVRVKSKAKRKDESAVT
jgi:hypothetical protein